MAINTLGSRDLGQMTGNGAQWKVLEEVKSVASRACQKQCEQDVITNPTPQARKQKLEAFYKPPAICIYNHLYSSPSMACQGSTFTSSSATCAGAICSCWPLRPVATCCSSVAWCPGRGSWAKPEPWQFPRENLWNMWMTYGFSHHECRSLSGKPWISMAFSYPEIQGFPSQWDVLNQVSFIGWNTYV